MSRLPIRIYGDPVLQTRAKEVPGVTPELLQLAGDMFETMAAARGVGLAANQVGVLERILVLDVPSDEEEGPRFHEALLNPVVLSKAGQQTGEEGCLSFPGLYFDVSRPNQVRVRATFLDGQEHEIEAEGYLARAIQHEIDHLDGVLYIDRISSMKRGLLRSKLQEIRSRGTADETREDE